MVSKLKFLPHFAFGRFEHEEPAPASTAMASSSSDKENMQRLRSASKPSWCPPPPGGAPQATFPPLPPPDARESMRQAPPRRFGVRITNTLDAQRAHEVAVLNTENKMLPLTDEAAGQRCQPPLPTFPQRSVAPDTIKRHTLDGESARGENQGNPAIKSEDNPVSERDLGTTAAFPAPSMESPPLLESSLGSTPLQPGRTIWSVTPDELSALAEELKTEATAPARKLSYAEASKRNLPGFAESQAVQTLERVEVEQPTRTFRKYYGLPNLLASGPPAHDAGALEEKENLDGIRTPEVSASTPSDVLDYSQIFGLSADTPKFYPRQSTDTNEFLQMLKASLSSKKVAPHMDWWPGDWKCTNCVGCLGNHNFSYRDTCKRCRVGRLEDAGFVYPPPTSDSST